MMDILALLKILMPFLKEYVFKELDIKALVRENRGTVISLLLSTVLFVNFVYALNQADSRLNLQITNKSKTDLLNSQINTLKDQNTAIQAVCKPITTDVVMIDENHNGIDDRLENKLNKLAGLKND